MDRSDQEFDEIIKDLKSRRITESDSHMEWDNVLGPLDGGANAADVLDIILIGHGSDFERWVIKYNFRDSRFNVIYLSVAINK